MFCCLYKFKIIQYILKYKCICICILSYYTYSGTEYSDSLFDHNTWVLYCLFSYFFICASPWGVLYTPEGEYSNCPPNRGIPIKSLVFWLKCTVNGSGHSCMYQLCQYQLLALLYTCMSSIWYFSLLFTGLPPLMMSWEHPMMSLGVGVPSLTVISFGTDSNTCLFIWFIPYSETFFSYMHQFFPIGWRSKF